MTRSLIASTLSSWSHLATSKTWLLAAYVLEHLTTWCSRKTFRLIGNFLSTILVRMLVMINRTQQLTSRQPMRYLLLLLLLLSIVVSASFSCKWLVHGLCFYLLTAFLRLELLEITTPRIALLRRLHILLTGRKLARVIKVLHSDIVVILFIVPLSKRLAMAWP